MGISLGELVINLYNNKQTISQNQNIYDAFNNFIFSNDRKIFNKLLYRIKFYEMTKHLHGDIVECGVFKGSGLLTWLKLIDYYEPSSLKKVIGFDFFDPNFVEDLENKTDKNTMSQVFSRCTDLTVAELSKSYIEKTIIDAGFSSDKFELVQGNISDTSRNFVTERPGFRISILYLDLDLDNPTFDSLTTLWDRVVPGGLVVFDEYAYHSWSESNAVDRFFADKSVDMIDTKILAPSCYIKK